MPLNFDEWSKEYDTTVRSPKNSMRISYPDMLGDRYTIPDPMLLEKRWDTSPSSRGRSISPHSGSGASFRHGDKWAPEVHLARFLRL